MSQRDRQRLLEEILDMDEGDLFRYIVEQCEEMGIPFDRNSLNGDEKGRQALLNFIGDNIDTDLVGFLHSECQLEPGCSMFPETETDDELEEELEHYLNRG